MGICTSSSCVTGSDIVGSHTIEKISWDECELSHKSFHKTGPLLGIGGSGVVRAVTKLDGSRKPTIYALKTISKAHLLLKSKGPEAALSELKILSILSDTNCSSNFICQLHFAWNDENFCHFILDLGYGDLRFLLSKMGKFSERATKFYICQLLLALFTCHDKRILHR